MGDCTFSLTLIDSMLSGGSGLVLFGGTCPAHLSGAPAILRVVFGNFQRKALWRHSWPGWPGFVEQAGKYSKVKVNYCAVLWPN